MPSDMPISAGMYMSPTLGMVPAMMPGTGDTQRVSLIKSLPVTEWRDRVVGERKGGRVAFCLRVLDYTNVYMLNCHTVKHEATGMMRTVEVYK